MKKVVILTLALMFFCLTANQVFAADFASIMNDAKTKYAKFEDMVKDMTVRQDTMMTANGANMPMSTKMYIKGNKFRAESTTTAQGGAGANQGQGMPMQTTIIGDGKDTWMISPYMGKTKINADQDSQYKEKSNWWSMISDKAQVAGMENVGSRACYIIESKSDADKYPFRKIWVDKDKLYMVKAETAASGGQPMTTLLSDFKEVSSGWEMPYKIEVIQNGKLLSTTVVKSLEINKGVGDDLFDASKIQAKEFNMQDYMKQMQKR